MRDDVLTRINLGDLGCSDLYLLNPYKERNVKEPIWAARRPEPDFIYVCLCRMPSWIGSHHRYV